MQFKEPDEEEECHLTPVQQPRAEGRGRNILKKETATSAIPRRLHTSDDVPSGVGSPLGKHPGNRVPQGDPPQVPGAIVGDVWIIHQLEAVIKEEGTSDPAKAPRGDTHSVASAKDRAATVSSVRGSEEGAAQKGQKHATRPERRWCYRPPTL